ncbi:MAG: hypothetical protein ACREKL_04655 [Chthoniobacterales bacterium]
MKTTCGWARLYWLLPALLVLTGCGGPKDPNVGLWGSKFNDQYPIFIKVTPGRTPDAYFVNSYFLNGPDSLEYRETRVAVAKEDGLVKGRFFTLKGDPKTGTAEGHWGGADSRPVIFVKVKGDGPPAPADADKVLTKSGWKPGAAPAE